MADPVSWLLIEPGWEVVDEAGERIGRVEQVRGDQEKDIFDGLDVATGLTGDAEYVPSEQVGPIFEGRVVVRR